MINDPVVNSILASAVIHNSPEDVATWVETAQITRLEFRRSGVHVDHTKRFNSAAVLGGAPPDSWPDFTPPGWDGPLQYTLWIFLNIGGAWHGSGCIQFWRTCDENGGPPEEVAKNWYYAEDRWAPMSGHQPAPGELVGFMVTAGDARNNGTISVKERSDLVLMPFPKSGAVYTPVMVGAPPTNEAPSAGDVPPVATQPGPDILDDYKHVLVDLRQQIADLNAKFDTVLTKVEALIAKRAPVYRAPTPAVNNLFIRLPAGQLVLTPDPDPPA